MRPDALLCALDRHGLGKPRSLQYAPHQLGPLDVAQRASALVRYRARVSGDDPATACGVAFTMRRSTRAAICYRRATLVTGASAVRRRHEGRWRVRLYFVTSRVYVETSIPSFFYEERPQPEMVARRTWTRDWWATASTANELVTSLAVVEELERGEFAAKESCLELVAKLPLLAIEPPILEVVEAYIRHRVMPADPVGDALHLALASYHRCDFLVTWNCRHIANANKFGHIRRVNAILGLYNPSLVTPLELLGGTEDAD
jgi:predicted nucleic acid-binding protein